MSSVGYLEVWAYTSTARFPLKDVAVTITAADGTAIAMGLTDRSGKIPAISIPVPGRQESQQPDPPEKPYTSVNLYAHLQGYEQVRSEGIQIFAGTVTSQNLEMIPLSELPNQWDQSILYVTPPQNL